MARRRGWKKGIRNTQRWCDGCQAWLTVALDQWICTVCNHRLKE